MRLRVVHEQPVFEVLAGIGEVEAEHLGVATGRGVLDRRGDANEVAAEITDVVPQHRVTTEPSVVRGSVDGVVAQSCTATTVSDALSPITNSTFSA